MVTDLPDPLSPTTPRSSPGAIEKLTPLTAWTAPSRVANTVRRSETSRTGAGPSSIHRAPCGLRHDRASSLRTVRIRGRIPITKQQEFSRDNRELRLDAATAPPQIERAAEGSNMPTGLNPREMLARLVAFPTVSTRSNLDLDRLRRGLPRRARRARAPRARRDRREGEPARARRPGGRRAASCSPATPTWSRSPARTGPATPSRLAERDGRLHGRGTCDMKGFCAIALALVPEMLAAGLPRPILLALTRDEEIGCIGAPPLIEAMLARDAAAPRRSSSASPRRCASSPARRAAGASAPGSAATRCTRA